MTVELPAPRALLFDMDGLLIDSEPLWAEVEADFARARGGEFTAAHAQACVGRGLVHTLEFMSATFGFPVDLARDTEDIVGRFLARTPDLALKRGARALLDEAAGRVKIALGSSSSRRIVAASLQAVGVAASFEVVVTGDDVARTKPAPDIFLECARQLGVRPSECVVLEDSLAGAQAGRAAGARVIAVPEPATDEAPFRRFAYAVVPDLVAARRLLSLRS
jgi:sugar-phosphatase